jgi:hypothetical protein
MKNNTISVRAYIVTDDINDILENASPKKAIENYLCPDMRPPVQTIVIEAKTHDGKMVTLSITPSSISANIE